MLDMWDWEALRPIRYLKLTLLGAFEEYSWARFVLTSAYALFSLVIMVLADVATTKMHATMCCVGTSTVLQIPILSIWQVIGP